MHTYESLFSAPDNRREIGTFEEEKDDFEGRAKLLEDFYKTDGKNKSKEICEAEITTVYKKQLAIQIEYYQLCKDYYKNLGELDVSTVDFTQVIQNLIDFQNNIEKKVEQWKECKLESVKPKTRGIEWDYTVHPTKEMCKNSLDFLRDVNKQYGEILSTFNELLKPEEKYNG